MLTPAARRPEEEGFSLVELLVVMVIMGAVGTIALQAVISSFRATARADARIEAIHEIETATQRLSRELRVADPLVISATGDFEREVGADVYRDGKLYSYFYTIQPGADGYDLIQQLEIYALPFDPATDSPVVAPDVRLMTQVALSEAEFRYFLEDGTPIECDPAAEGLATCQSEYAAARRIQVELVRVLDHNQSPLTAVSTVNVRNARYQTAG